MVVCGWGHVQVNNPEQVHLSSTNTNVAIGQEDLAIRLRCRFLANGDVQVPADALAEWE